MTARTLAPEPPRPGPALLRDAAYRLQWMPDARPGPVDVRGAIRAELVSHVDVGTLACDELVRETWGLVDAWWARRGRPTYDTVDDWVEVLREVAAHYEHLAEGLAEAVVLGG